MWYNYLRRDVPYMRHYRTHNLWLNHYQKKIRTHRIQGLSVGFLKRMAKHYSGIRVMSALWGLSWIGFFKFFNSFKDKPEASKTEPEMYNRLLTIFQKNKFGYHTRIMSDFDLLLEASMNERFLNESTEYYDDFQEEIEDMELGLNGDMSEADIAFMMSDKGDHHDAGKLCVGLPGRFGTNYAPTDNLSVYKVLPKGEKQQI